MIVGIDIGTQSLKAVVLAPEMKIHVPLSYVVSRLTGVHAIDHATASTSMVYGLKAQAYDAALLDAFGITADELPRAVDASAVAGSLTAAGASLTGLNPG